VPRASNPIRRSVASCKIGFRRLGLNTSISPGVIQTLHPVPLSRKGGTETPPQPTLCIAWRHGLQVSMDMVYT